MKKKQIIVFISVALIVVGLAAFLFVRAREPEKEETVAEEVGEEAGFETITYNGEKYKYNTDLKTILFMGVDNTSEVQVQDYAGRGGQSDTLILLILDTAKKETRTLQISRESMTDVDVYDMDGTFLSTEKAQICLQYAYGDGGKRSCLLTKEAVSQLLYGLPVQSYISLNIDGIAALSEALGGIEITVPEDYTMIDPSLVQGATVKLSGRVAEKYVRYRDQDVTGSNNQRMERQNQVMEALALQLPRQAKEDPSLYRKLYSAAGPYMVTDLSSGEMDKLASYESVGEVERVPGEVTAGAEHDEFYVDDEKLYELLIKMFYKKI